MKTKKLLLFLLLSCAMFNVSAQITIDQVVFHGKQVGVFNNKNSDLDSGGTTFVFLKNTGASDVEIHVSDIALTVNSSALTMNMSSTLWYRMWPCKTSDASVGIVPAGGKMTLTINSGGSPALLSEGKILAGTIGGANLPVTKLTTPQIRIGAVIPSRDYKSVYMFVRNQGSTPVSITDYNINGYKDNAIVVGSDIAAGSVGIIKVPFTQEQTGAVNYVVQVTGMRAGVAEIVAAPVRMLVEPWFPIGTWYSTMFDNKTQGNAEFRNMLIDTYWIIDGNPTPNQQNQAETSFIRYVRSNGDNVTSTDVQNSSNDKSLMAWQTAEEPELDSKNPNMLLPTNDRAWADPNHPTFVTLCENRTFQRYSHLTDIVLQDHYGSKAATNVTNGWDPDQSTIISQSTNNSLYSVLDFAEQLKENSQPQRMWMWSQLASSEWNSQPAANTVYAQAWMQIAAGSKGLIWFNMRKDYTSNSIYKDAVEQGTKFAKEFTAIRGLALYSDPMYSNIAVKVISPAPVDGKVHRKILARAIVGEEAMAVIIVNNNADSNQNLSDQSGVIEVNIPNFINLDDAKFWQVTKESNAAIVINKTTRTAKFTVNLRAESPAQVYVIGKVDVTPPEKIMAIANAGRHPSENSFLLSWKDGFDNYGVKTYKVYRDGELIAITDVPCLWTGSTADKNLFTVSAVDAAGNEGLRSEPLEVTNKVTLLNVNMDVFTTNANAGMNVVDNSGGGNWLASTGYAVDLWSNDDLVRAQGGSNQIVTNLGKKSILIGSGNSASLPYLSYFTTPELDLSGEGVTLNFKACNDRQNNATTSSLVVTLDKSTENSTLLFNKTIKDLGNGGNTNAPVYNPTDYQPITITNGGKQSRITFEVNKKANAHRAYILELNIQKNNPLRTDIPAITDNTALLDYIIPIEDETSSVSENNLTEGLVFPNPFTDDLYVGNSIKATFFSSAGILVAKYNVESNTVSTKQLANGCYLLQLEYADGRKITCPVIKQ